MHERELLCGRDLSAHLMLVGGAGSFAASAFSVEDFKFTHEKVQCLLLTDEGLKCVFYARLAGWNLSPNPSMRTHVL